MKQSAVPLSVIFPFVRKIAQKLEEDHESIFNQDPEAYTVDLISQLEENCEVGATVMGSLELAGGEESMEAARKLLKRKKVTSK